MNLFIYSTSYVTRLFAHELKYITGECLDKIVVLGENHFLEDFQFEKNSVVLCENVNEALNISDIVVVLNNGKLPDKKMNHIIEHCCRTYKKIVPIDITTDCLKLDEQLSLDSKMDIPMILNVGIGDSMSTYRLELSLNRMFFDTNVKIFQSFSSFTSIIINTLKKHNIVNKNFIFEEDKQLYEKFQVNIKSTNYANINSLIKCFYSISNFKPDYLIINMNGRPIDMMGIENLFKYRYGLSPFFVQSKYIDINKDDQNYRPIYCHSLGGDCFFGDQKILSKLKHDIMVRLAFPSSIVII